MHPEGLVTRLSRYAPKETADRLSAAVAGLGLTLVTRVDHAGAAANVGLDLRPTELLIFGNARAGTPLMQTSQLAVIDLPLRALVWQDEAGATWISYVDPAFTDERHGIPDAATKHGIADAVTKSVDMMTSALQAVTAEATA